MLDMAEKRDVREGHHKVGFVFPVEVTEEMKRLAREHNRSLVGEIVWALREYIARQKSERAARLS